MIPCAVAASNDSGSRVSSFGTRACPSSGFASRPRKSSRSCASGARSVAAERFDANGGACEVGKFLREIGGVEWDVASTASSRREARAPPPAPRLIDFHFLFDRVRMRDGRRVPAHR